MVILYCRLDDTLERNCDYLLAINFFTAYLLQMIGKLKESLNFIFVAEKMLQKLLLTLKTESGASPGVTGEVNISRMTRTLLSNYLLGISLMRNIAIKYTNPKGYKSE